MFDKMKQLYELQKKAKLESRLNNLFSDDVQSSQKKSASFSQDLLKGISLPGLT